MKHPDPNKVRDVAMTFDLVSRFNNKVDMDNGSIYEESCGSPCCHGGWFEFAYNDVPVPSMGFIEGSISMASYLGFSRVRELENWAKTYPEIWGNDFGQFMFLDDLAFNHKDKITLRDIAIHWYKVADRIEEIYEVPKERD